MNVYLRPDVVLEPLFNRWLVDGNLIPPIQAALTLVHSHLAVLRSYLANPAVHFEASQDLTLAGGPVAAVDPSRVDEMKALLEKTERENGDLIEIAAAVKALDTVLNAETSGLSLDATYHKVPPILQGYVELTYDMQHRTAARFLEGLLYRSPFYKPQAQSLMLCRATGDVRAFGYSTPRLPDAGRHFLAMPFADPRVDALAALRHTPAPLATLVDRFEVAAAERTTFEGLFTDVAPPPRAAFAGPGARVRYFGHAALLVEGDGRAVLVDPTLGYAHGQGMPRYSFADLPARIDAVLITHGHADHLSIEALLQLRHRVDQVIVARSGTRVVDPSLESMLRVIGFANVRAVDEMDEVRLGPDQVITALPFLGEHGDLDIRAKSTYAIRLGGATVVAAADAAGMEPRVYELARRELGTIDALFLAMEPHGAPLTWGYGPLFVKTPTRKMDQSRRQRAASQDETVAMLKVLHPKRFFNYAMGQEPWLTHVMALKYTDASPQIVQSNQLLEHCRAKGIPAERPLGRLELTL